MTTASQLSLARTRINRYTRALIIAVSTFVFLSVVPFLPGYPVVQLLIAVILGASSLKRPGWTAGVLALFAFLTIIWQLIGFGFFELMGSPPGIFTLALLMLFVAFDLVSANMQPTAMALALLAVALMLTPYYYLSIGAIVVAAALGGLSSIAPVSTTFISTLAPFLVIDNAIYYNGTSSGTQMPPVIFSQLSNLSANLIPPLGSLNIFLTGIGPGASSPYAQTFISFVTGGRTAVLLIPLIILIVVFSLSTTFASIINAFIGRLDIFGRFNSLVKGMSPLIAAVAAPAAFAILIVLLSPTNVGGYQTSLAQHSDDIILLLGSSVVLGGAATGREFFIRRLERVEFARDELSTLLDAAGKSIAGTREVLAKITKDASTVRVATEAKQLDEVVAYLGDIRKGIGTASYTSLDHWIEDFKTRVRPLIDKMPEALRIKVIDELNKLKAFSSAYNLQMEAAGASERFPEPAAIDGAMSTESALARYEETTSRISDSAKKVFQDYRGAAEAFNSLMGSRLIAPPVNPESLLDSRDYLTVMKLLAEEYWVNFQISHTEDLEAKVNALREQLRQLSGLLDAEGNDKLVSIFPASENVTPAASPKLLEEALALKETLRQSVGRARQESNELEMLVRTFKPGALNIVRFEVLEQSNTISQLQNLIEKVDPNLGDLTEFVKGSIPIFIRLRDGRRADEHALVLLSQYHIAEKFIQSAMRERKSIPLSELPFQREAALMYVKLYSSTSKDVRYDDFEEAMVVSDA